MAAGLAVIVKSIKIAAMQQLQIARHAIWWVVGVLSFSDLLSDMFN